MPRYSRRRLLAGGATSLGLFIAGCSGGDGGTADGGPTGETGGERHSVEMTGDLSFEPDGITIAPGDTVVWENVSNANHTVTALNIPAEAEYFASGGFDSEAAAREAYNSDREGVVAPDNTYEYTFTVEGGYRYYCIRHENHGMSGSVTVREE